MTASNNPKARVVEILASFFHDEKPPVEYLQSMADRLDAEGLLVKPGYIGEIDAGDWELATIRLDIDRQMFKDGQVRMGGQVLIIPQPQKE